MASLFLRIIFEDCCDDLRCLWRSVKDWCGDILHIMGEGHQKLSRGHFATLAKVNIRIALGYIFCGILVWCGRRWMNNCKRLEWRFVKIRYVNLV